ncbi:hypothetical protein [Desemzia sp. FAM 24101]|uniref:hypothetical protein n=1 Tax=unclassified Desemzia TaxID=2685243 RepID=UPI00388B9AF5
MNKMYILKVLFLIIMIPGIVYYFLKTPVSEVTIVSFFILFFTAMQVHEEVSLTRQPSDKRTNYQVGIDRTVILLLIIISIDIIASVWGNGISL